MTLQKKKLLQKILKALVPYWDLAKWFQLLINETEDDELIDSLYEMISNQIKSIKDEDKRKNINKALKQIKEKEEEESKGNNEYLENLINNI